MYIIQVLQVKRSFDVSVLKRRPKYGKERSEKKGCFQKKLVDSRSEEFSKFPVTSPTFQVNKGDVEMVRVQPDQLSAQYITKDGSRREVNLIPNVQIEDQLFNQLAEKKVLGFWGWMMLVMLDGFQWGEFP